MRQLKKPIILILSLLFQFSYIFLKTVYVNVEVYFTVLVLSILNLIDRITLSCSFFLRFFFFIHKLFDLFIFLFMFFRYYPDKALLTYDFTKLRFLLVHRREHILFVYYINFKINFCTGLTKKK